MKRFVTILMCAIIALCCFSCGDDSGTEGNDGTKITIFAGGSSEFKWPSGSKEAEVIEAIEDKYYQDKGIKLDFVINNTLGQSMKSHIVTDVNEGKIDVIISHTGGGDGIDDWAMDMNIYYDLDTLMQQYLADYIDEGLFLWDDGDGLEIDALKRMTTVGREVIGIPSVINPYKFGILVRKDWMLQAGYTDDKTDTARTYVGDFETFTAMAEKMISQQNLKDGAIGGAIFDVEKAGVLGANGVNAGYYSNTLYAEDEKNYVGPGYIHPDYAKVLETEHSWSQKGILAADPDKIMLEEGEANFVAGKTGIFLQDPTVTHLIEVARRCKKENPEAEFTVLGALTKTPESTDKGFMRNSVAAFSAVIPKNSPNAKLVMQFLRWMYESKENYLLCKYGREGIDWIYDEENQTYDYPENSGNSIYNPPYSGILALVENQNMADLTYAGYTDEERSWIRTAREKQNYIVNDTVDYLLYSNNKENRDKKGTAAVNISSGYIRPYWSGTKNGNLLPISNYYPSARTAFMTGAQGFMTDLYNAYLTLKG